MTRRQKIEGFPRYQVGNDGSVWSNYNAVKEWRRLKCSKSNGYTAIRLSGDSLRFRRVHRLVLEAFVGPCPPRSEGLHRDGNNGNNKLSNLRWGTRSENEMDKVLHGRSNRGERHPMARLTSASVRDIKRLRESGLTLSSLADCYSVGVATVDDIVKGRTWANG